MGRKSPSGAAYAATAAAVSLPALLPPWKGRNGWPGQRRWQIKGLAPRRSPSALASVAPARIASYLVQRPRRRFCNGLQPRTCAPLHILLHKRALPPYILQAMTVDPICAPTPAEVPLPHAPLARVLAQVKFPPVLALNKDDATAGFQDAIRARYPVLRPEAVQGFGFGPGIGVGVIRVEPQRAWRFLDISGAWRVTLAQDFLSLETTAYDSRQDFLARLSEVLTALSDHVRPALADRIGLRYIDQVVGEHEAAIGQLVRPEVVGLAATPAAARIRHTISETLFDLGEFNLLMRSGQLPPQTTPDPSVLPAVDQKSWILDLDMATKEPRPFEPGSIVELSRHFAERIYTVFRWAVSDEFLRRFGGQP